MSKELRLLVNGVAAQHLSAFDRGLQFGDGLFETIAVKKGQPQCWELHLRRLCRGCQQLLLPPPDVQTLRDEVEKLCSDVDRGILKIILTRGIGDRGYRIPVPTNPTRIVSLHPWPSMPDVWAKEGVTVRICSTRLSRNERLAGVKHLNRLEQVLARSEWDDPSIAEGLMFDTDDFLIEGTCTNVFCVVEGNLLTPNLRHCGIEGITRERILMYAMAQDLDVRIVDLRRQDLSHASEVFLCNTVAGIWPVTHVVSDEVWHFAGNTIAHRLQNDLLNDTTH